MIKILNDRPLFYCFLAFGFGILFARPIFSLEIIPCILISLCIGLIAFFCIKYKKIVSVFLIIICFLLGILSFFISTQNFKSKDYSNQECLITGRICVVNIIEDNQSVILDNVYINQEKINSNLILFVYNSNELEEGTIIEFKSKPENTSLFTLKNFNSYNYKYDVHYSAYVSLDDITVNYMNKLSWSEKLKLSVKYQLFKNMDYDSASVCYASLFGDKTYIETSLKTSFSISGIAHLLAVSGLHVGFLVGFLAFLLNLTRMKKYLKFGIIIFILGIYCYLCDFSASVLRASIMFLILDLANLFGKRYDKLNAWGLAGIVCLLFRPLSVYDGGFLLSFCCVLCIFMFAKPLSQKLQKWHIPKFLVSTLGVMIPVQFGLLPLVSLYYNEISLFSILANFICVPLFEIFFVMLFVCLPIVLIIPIFSFVLFLPKTIISFIMHVASLISSIDFAIVRLTALTGLVVILIYLLLFLSSHYVNLKSKVKVLSIWVLTIVGLFSAIMSTYACNARESNVTVLNTNNTNYCIELDGVSFVIGNFDGYSIDNLENYLVMSRLYNVDYFISLNGSIPSKERTYFKNVYSCQTEGEFKLSENKIVKNDIKLEPIYISNKFVGLFINSKSTSIMIFAEIKLNDLQYAQLGESFYNLDLVIGSSKMVDNFTQYNNAKTVLKDGKTVYNVKNDNLYSSNGNWTFEIKQGNIFNMRGVD